MVVKKKRGGSDGYDKLRADLSAGNLGKGDNFYGGEGYPRE